jgi:hypothetical protein
MEDFKMKNIEKKWRSFASAKLIIAIVAVIGFGFTACGDGSGTGGGGSRGSLAVTVKDNNSGTLTNIILKAVENSQPGRVLYDSGTISIAPGETFPFNVNNISWTLIGTQPCFSYVTVNGTEYSANLMLDKDKNPANLEIKNDGYLGYLIN